MTDNTQPEALREGRWYMVTHDGVATLCEDLRDAEKEAKDADMAWPHSGPHRAVQLVEASTAGCTAADMATASAQGFRDGVASLSANAREPVAMYSIDADPQGIRSTVAEAITGALAFGALGVNQPPEGHWLAPFWKAAREDKEAVRVKRDLRQELQQQCSTWGAYWRGSDAHGVVISHPQAVELLQIALGVEVEIEIRGCQTCDYTGVIGEMPCPDCAAPPAAQAEGWVSVEERLPAKNTEVLICFAESTLPSTGQYTGHAADPAGWCYPKESYLWPGESEKLPDGGAPTVTHWMPLPLTPTSAEGVEHG